MVQKICDDLHCMEYWKLECTLVSSIVWLEENGTMLTTTQLDELDGPDYITCHLDDDEEGTNYFGLLERMAVACTGRELGNSANSVRDIRVTVGPGVYIVHFQGLVGGHLMNLKLMGAKESNYLLAVFRNGSWDQVKGSPIPIEGANNLKFSGSYVDSTTGLAGIRVGLMGLLNALIALDKGSKEVDCFMVVVVNLFEAARYYEIGYAVIENRFVNVAMKEYFLFLIHHWGSSISVSVRCYQALGIWREFKAFTFQDDQGKTLNMSKEINEGTVASRLRICKCKEVGNTELWASEAKKKTRHEKDPIDVKNCVLDLNSLQANEEAAIREAEMEAQRIGVGVTSEAQSIFDALSKMFPVRWDKTVIVVMDQIQVSSPYLPKSVTGGTLAENKLVRKELTNWRRKSKKA